jgi:polyisoprenyl-teichoic acid--peptidoglycan teichoic acid transferase
MILGAVIVLLCTAGGSAVFVVEQVHTLRDALAQNGTLRTGGTLAAAGWGDPQTLLLVGDDQRSLTQYYHRAVPHLANEMLLVRLDPSKPYISMMSIPRELWVTIYPPGQQAYTNRLNSAYTHGIGVLVSTIKRVLGLPVNHVVVITFGRFKRAVNEMGCVYSTVDRRYYHVNVPGSEQYQEINLQPGYQKLCGIEALQFVSYRHGDTSLVRDARDQSFLLDVKKQYGPTLSSNVGKFEHIFGKAVQTDPGLQSTTGILNLLGTLISSSGRRVRQVHFNATLLSAYDTATPQQIASSVRAFLHGGSAIPKQTTAAQAHSVHTRKAVAQLPLVPTPPSYLGQARAAATQLAFPLEFPHVEDRGGSIVPPALRSYLIHAPGGSAYPGYVAVFYGGSLGQYYDVQGTTWTTAPQFDSPDQTVRVGGRKYLLYYEGSNLKMVAWYEHGAVYWVRNSLADSIQNGELLAIAEQTAPFTATAAGPGHARVILKAAGVPTKAAKTATLSTRETIGSIAGVVTLIALPLLALLAILRIRELRKPRSQLVSGQQLGSRLPSFDAPIAAPRPVPATGIQPSLAGVMAARPGTYAEPRWSDERRTYRRSRLRTPVGMLAALLVLAAVVVGAILLLTRGGHPAASAQHRSGATRTAPPLPTVPVAVLNATPTAGAAHQVALQLQGDRVSVSTVANVVNNRPPGVEVLYAANQLAQAQRVARLLSGRSPTIAPIDPVSAAAAGSGAQVVVEIT